MGRSKTKSFTAEFPLRTHKAQENVLDNRFKAVANLSNSVLVEALHRERKVRSDPDWDKARQMPKRSPEERKARSSAFYTVVKRHEFRGGDIQKFAENMRDNSWIGHHLSSHDTQTTAKRAYRAVTDWIYKGKGRPHCKPEREFDSVEGKSNAAVIRFRTVNGVAAIYWDKLVMPLVLDSRDKTDWQKQALACRTKYVRIVRRKLKGITRYYAQLVQEGEAPKRNLVRAKTGTGCFDLGTSTAGIFVPDKLACLQQLAPTVEPQAKESRRIQRAMAPDLGHQPGSFVLG